jgi:uncharacterized protein with FMN-binding domain
VKRAPVVLASTAVGFVAVVTFHTHPQRRPLVATEPPASTPARTPHRSRASSRTHHRASRTRQPTSKTVLGADSPNRYGDVQVKVTMTNGKIASITAVRLPEQDQRSADISSQAEPMLRTQALAAQSAQINGVSGASYTSDSYRQSLQSALVQLQKQS